MKPVNNFGDLPAEYCYPATSKIVMLGVPYDGTSTWNKGADKGPDAIVAASANMELYDIEDYRDCCSLAAHSSPSTKVKTGAARTLESKLDIDQVVRKTLEKTEMIEI